LSIKKLCVRRRSRLLSEFPPDVIVNVIGARTVVKGKPRVGLRGIGSDWLRSDFNYRTQRVAGLIQLGSYSASRKGAALTFSLTSANITPDSESVCFVIILTKFVIQCQCTISLRHSREWVCGISGNGSRVRQCLNTPFYECQPSRGIYTVSQKNKKPNCCPNIGRFSKFFHR